jgi:hypothetical protein
VDVLDPNQTTDSLKAWAVPIYCIPCRDWLNWQNTIPIFAKRLLPVRLTANAEVATVLGSIPASSVTVESEGRQMKQC